MENHESTSKGHHALLTLLKKAAEEIAAEGDIDWDAFPSEATQDEIRKYVTECLTRAEADTVFWDFMGVDQREQIVETLLYGYSILSLIERKNAIESVLQSL